MERGAFKIYAALAVAVAISFLIGLEGWRIPSGGVRAPLPSFSMLPDQEGVAKSSTSLDDAKRRQIASDLVSQDPDRMAAAVAEVDFSALGAGDRKHPHPKDLQMLLSAGRYADAASISLEGILEDPSHTSAVESFTAIRAEALLRQGNAMEALAAANAYYNVCSLQDTSDALELTVRCLAEIHPNDSDIVSWFLKAQFLGTSLAAATRPDTQLARPGLSIFPPGSEEAARADSTINANGGNYSDFVGEGNLLLLVGRVSEARAAFENAMNRCDQRHLSIAIENIARAIRAQAGCLGPANAFIISLRSGSWTPALAASNASRKWRPSDLVRAASDTQLAVFGLHLRGSPGFSKMAPQGVLTEDSPDQGGFDGLKALASRDPKATAWLIQWANSDASTKTDITSLRVALADTTLSPQTLISIGNIVGFYSNDETVTACFYAAAISRGHAELLTYKAGDPRIKPLITTLFAAKSLVWEAFETGNQDTQFLEASLSVLYGDLIRWTPRDDVSLRDILIHGYVGKAECLYLQGQYSEAASLLDSLSAWAMDSSERAALSKIYPLVLCKLGRDADSLPYLEDLVTRNVDGDAAYFAGYLFRVAIDLHRADVARQAYDALCLGGHPSSFADAELVQELHAVERSAK